MVERPLNDHLKPIYFLFNPYRIYLCGRKTFKWPFKGYLFFVQSVQDTWDVVLIYKKTLTLGKNRNEPYTNSLTG